MPVRVRATERESRKKTRLSLSVGLLSLPTLSGRKKKALTSSDFTWEKREKCAQDCKTNARHLHWQCAFDAQLWHYSTRQKTKQDRKKSCLFHERKCLIFWQDFKNIPPIDWQTVFHFEGNVNFVNKISLGQQIFINYHLFLTRKARVFHSNIRNLHRIKYLPKSTLSPSILTWKT